MDNYAELPGTLVLVHPKLTNDPLERKNQIGTITGFDIENDEFVVKFNDKGLALFSADALLVLRPLNEMERDASNDATLMPYEDYQDLMEVITFATSSEKHYRMVAIEIARYNSNILEYTMNSLEYQLGRNRNAGLNR